jgi:hypothetical protein
MKATARVVATIALGWGVVVAIAGYAVLHTWQVLASAPVDPAKVAPGPHSAFFWNSLTASYAGGMAAFVAAALARPGSAAAARWLGPAAIGAAVLLTLQVLLWP